MILVQLTGLSGAGKSTIALKTKIQLVSLGYAVEIIDGDEYRKSLCKDLGFSKEDRCENIRRLGFVGLKLVQFNVIVLIAAINPFEAVRTELKNKSNLVKTVWVNCDIETLRRRDTKGLYYRAFLPDHHEQKIHNLSGVNDPFEPPQDVDLIIHTNESTEEASADQLLKFILSNIKDVSI
ncbi:MAG: adenylyl-sulfate kinase [Bacteroidota bacterium]|jgi:adenylylsulfate kinase